MSRRILTFILSFFSFSIFFMFFCLFVFCKVGEVVVVLGALLPVFKLGAWHLQGRRVLAI